MVGWHSILAEKKIWKVTIYKNRPFWPIHGTSVLPAVAKRICQISIILVHCIECSSTFSLRPRKLEMLKAWNNKDVPIYLFLASVNIQNCIGLRKKFPGLGHIISVSNSSVEVFMLCTETMEGNRWQHCAFSSKI